jgi:hypothetical protein
MEGRHTVKTLYIHAGFPKTGSSFLQTVFSRNAAHMAEEYGIAYIEPDKASKMRAKAGRISSGNGGWLHGQLSGGVPAEKALAPYLDTDANASLISNENFIHCDEEQLGALRDAAEARGYKVRAVAFIRDPFELAISAYLQNVKRGTISPPFEQWVHQFRYRHDKFAALFGSVLRHGEFLNYGDHKSDLVRGFFQLIDRVEVSLPDVPDLVVNRSISQEECHFLLKLNAQHGDVSLSRQVSDYIVENHPFIGTEVRHSWHSFSTLCHMLQRDPKREAETRNFKDLREDPDPGALVLAAERIQTAMCHILIFIEKQRRGLDAVLPKGAKKKAGKTADQGLREQFVSVEHLDAVVSSNRILRARNRCIEAMHKTQHSRKHQKIIQACQELGQEHEFENILKFLVRRRHYDAALWVDSYVTEKGYPSLISDQEREGLMAESASANKRLPLLKRLISR